MSHPRNCEGRSTCPECIRNDDRWDTVAGIFSILVVFSTVIPVIPMIIYILLQL